MQTIIKIVLLALIISLFLISTKVIAEAPKYIEQPPNIKVYAFEKVLNRWGSEQWDSFDKLIKKESKWDSEAQNPNSSAYGIGQFLNSTWSTVDCEKTKDVYKQIDCTINYVELNYKTPQKALQFHLKNNYY